MDTRQNETGNFNKRSSSDKNVDRDFATHYYGNEKDLRKRDRAARAESHSDERENSERQRDFSKRGSIASEEQKRDRAARDSDIGREPYSPERPYHRAGEDAKYSASSNRKNWKEMSSDLFNDFSTLIRKERSLVSAELGEKASLIKQGAVSITSGTIISFVGFNALAATIVLALGNVMAWWLAALVTGIGFLLIGLGLMATAKKKLSGDSLTPYRSMESFDHMGSMLKEKKDEFTRH